MNVLLATTWDTACGIAEHSAYLKAAVEAADHGIAIHPTPEALDPAAADPYRHGWDLLHLNYHRALHSRWTPEKVRQVAKHRKVVITFHDTFGEHPPDDLSRELCDAADAFIVHEPCEGLPNAIYWRMGVPPPRSPMQFTFHGSHPPDPYWRTLRWCFKGWDAQPVLGTVGFAFPWKNYERLCDLTREVGWALLLIAPGATTEQVVDWQSRHPDLWVIPEFTPRDQVVELLAGCDATAFCYTCANSGQSGAVLQGIAARKPVFAFETCRQFRALFADPIANKYVRWCRTFEEFQQRLSNTILGRVDAGMVALAQQDSWTKLGANYAQLYRRLLA